VGCCLGDRFCNRLQRTPPAIAESVSETASNLPVSAWVPWGYCVYPRHREVGCCLRDSIQPPCVEDTRSSPMEPKLTRMKGELILQCCRKAARRGLDLR